MEFWLYLESTIRSIYTFKTGRRKFLNFHLPVFPSVRQSEGIFLLYIIYYNMMRETDFASLFQLPRHYFCE